MLNRAVDILPVGMSLESHKKGGWKNKPSMSGADAADAYTGGQAKFTASLRDAKMAVSVWSCMRCDFHAFGFDGDEQSKRKRWKNACSMMEKHHKKCLCGSGAAAAAAAAAAAGPAAAAPPAVAVSTTTAGVEMGSAAATASAPRVAPACPPCASTSTTGASTSTPIRRDSRVMVSGWRAGKPIPGRVTCVEDGLLLVALDDEGAGECEFSPSCVRLMTEVEEWQIANAAADSAPALSHAARRAALGLFPPSALSHVQAALIYQAVLSYIQERWRRSVRRRRMRLRRRIRQRRPTRVPPEAASGARARAKRLCPLPARRNQTAWRVARRVARRR